MDSKQSLKGAADELHQAENITLVQGTKFSRYVKKGNARAAATAAGVALAAFLSLGSAAAAYGPVTTDVHARIVEGLSGAKTAAERGDLELAAQHFAEGIEAMSVGHSKIREAVQDDTDDGNDDPSDNGSGGSEPPTESRFFTDSANLLKKLLP